MTKRIRHKIGDEATRKKPPQAEVLTDVISAAKKALEDFGRVSAQAFENFERRLNKKPFEQGGEQIRYRDDRLGDLLLYKEGLAWFGEGEGPQETPIGKPEDYVNIRDSYDALKKFLIDLLKRGRIYRGVNAVFDTSGETDTADYVIWMYKHSQNERFKRNVERAVIELSGEELAKEFAPLDIETELRKQEEDLRRTPAIYKKSDPDVSELAWVIDKESLDGALSRVNLQYNVEDTEDKKFKEYFIQELSKTERPITEEEYVAQFASSEEENRKQYATGEPAKRYKRIHYEETSPEFKAAFKKWYLEKRAKEWAVKKFTPQFNTLIGLLDIVIHLGKPNNGFAPIYGMLEEKARSGYFKDTPDLVYDMSAANIYNHVLVALTALQKGTKLREFWLDNISNDKNTQRVITAVNGLLRCHSSKEKRREEIPAILKALQERGYDVDKTQHYTAIGFIFDQNFLDKILAHISSLCFDKSYFERTFYHLDKEKGTLDFLVEKTANNGDYTFRSLRYTTDCASDITATCDLSEDRIDNTELESAIRAYFDQTGYEIAKDVFVTSLEGRKMGKETVLVEAGEQNLEGRYEGIVGLNHTSFGFVYDPTTNTILLAEPFDSRTVIFGVGENSAERRMGKEKIKAKIDTANFKTLPEVGKRVNEIVTAKKKQGYMGDSLYAMNGKLNDELAVHLARVVLSRLVKKQDGIWDENV